MFLGIKRIWWMATNLYSSKMANYGRYDKRDLLIGHGLDNLTSIRVVFGIGLAALIGLWLNCIFAPDFVAAVSFIMVFVALSWYVNNLPPCAIKDALDKYASKNPNAYRAYFGGRIIFTPMGLSLSMRRRQLGYVTTNAQQLDYQATQQTKTSANSLSQDTNEANTARAITSASGSAITKASGSSQLSPDNAPLSSTPDLNKDSQPAQLAQSTVTPPANQTDATNPSFFAQCQHKAVNCWQEFWAEPVAVPIYTDPSDNPSDSKQNTVPFSYYGFLQWPHVTSLEGKKLYPAVPFNLEQMSDLNQAMLPILEEETHHAIDKKDMFFLGFGFNWLPKHARRLQERLEVGLRTSSFDTKGSPDIHNVEDYDAFQPLYFNTKLLAGHTLLLGTTGSGKTRFFDLLISQAISRGETVIVIDPKGDKDLQSCILRAMRFAKREPIQELFCLDMSRPRGLDPNSAQAKHYSALSIGQSFDWQVSRKPEMMHDYERPLNIESFIEEEIQARAAEAEDNATNAKGNANQPNQNHILDACKASPADQNSPEVAPDEYFFQFMNTGLNPTSAFDRAYEIGERVCAMMPDYGSAASFKAYAQMAVSAAVECLQLMGQKVTLEQIRSLMSNHTSFINSFRYFLVNVVREINLPKVSTYFNRIHGVTTPQLQIYSISVPLLIGDCADESASHKKELALLQCLTENNVLKSTAETQRILSAAEKLEDLPEAEIEEKEEESATTTAKKKRTTSRAKKTPKGVHPASLSTLNAFYKWLIKNGYIPRNAGVDRILGIANLLPDFYRKVTNGIMPFLTALTAGDLADLLSGQTTPLPTFLDIVKNRKVMYVALHCMKDASTGQALGKLMMSDLAFVAGEINANPHVHFPKVSVFIDEASELSNEALIQLLNKSRSSNFSITLATQSMADLTKRTGSRESAEQIVANCNNLIALRVNDPDTAKIISSVLPHTVIGMRSSTITVSDKDDFDKSYTTSRTLQQQDASLFPSSVLMMLPDLEFIARMATGGCYKGFIPRLTNSKQYLGQRQDKQAQASQDHQDQNSTLNATIEATQANQQAQAKLNEGELVHLSTDFDPEFYQVSKMLDLGFQVQSEQTRLDDPDPMLLNKMLDKMNTQPHRLYIVEPTNRG